MKLGQIVKASGPILILAFAAACSRGDAKETEAKTAYAAFPQEQFAPPAIQGPVIAGGNPPPTLSLRNPYKGDAAVAEEGGTLYVLYNCDGCHIVGVGPNITDGRWRYGGSDGAIFESIYGGRPDGMPAYGAVLAGDAIWKIVTYLQSQQPAEDNPTVTC